MEKCESRDNFDRYLTTAESKSGGGSGGSQTNGTRKKSSPECGRASKIPKRETSDDDWSD